jgi:DNA-binding protein
MKHLAFFLFLALFSLRLDAQNENPQPTTIFEKLTASEVAELTLETDLTVFVGQKKTNNYLPGTLRMKDGKTYQVEVRARGRYRRKVSQIPPMKIRFSETELKAEKLDTLNEIKIALPYQISDQASEFIVKEYLAYRMFEKTSSLHFRARLVKLTLVDTNEKGFGKKKTYAIFIEDEEEVAQRLGCLPVDTFGLKPGDLEQQQAAMVSMFQYLIGNTDWDFMMQRNVQLFKEKEGGKFFVLPYDFDFSGLVGAPYAVPSSESGLKSVRDRYLMANGLDAEAMKSATKTLKEREKDYYQLCRSKFVASDTKDGMTDFLGTFFKNMEGKEEAPGTMLMKKE